MMEDDDDSQPFIDFIDGVFYQTNTFEELCEYYAKNYYRYVNPVLNQFITEDEFVSKFSSSIISKNIQDQDDFSNEATVIYNKLCSS